MGELSSITLPDGSSYGFKDAVARGALEGKESVSNKTTAISSASTDAQYPSAKCVYDLVGAVEEILHSVNNGNSS